MDARSSEETLTGLLSLGGCFKRFLYKFKLNPAVCRFLIALVPVFLSRCNEVLEASISKFSGFLKSNDESMFLNSTRTYRCFDTSLSDARVETDPNWQSFSSGEITSTYFVGKVTFFLEDAEFLV